MIQPLIVITGPTASGKSDLAMELAEKYGGEIICADSRTVYTGMDIGSAKPSQADRHRVPHHLLDIVTPDQRFSVADFQRLANEAIADVRARGKVPFLVGGSGLYINSVVLNYTLDEDNNGAQLDARRNDLEAHSIEELQSMIKKQRLEMPNDPKNKRRLVSRLMRGDRGLEAEIKLTDNVVVVGIATDSNELLHRIDARAEQMFAAGVVEEAVTLASRYGWDNEAMTGKIYPIIRRHVDGGISRQQTKDLSVIADRQLVKKQLTWMRRQEFIHWLSLSDAHAYIEQILSSRAAS